ncbi:MAG TPA: twin-arginine translocase subunit TatC [Candidatus Dormibacteraeota bacterium]|nr:twin-arginine translocase subunit TatC [Candidatus Dormibacteraeota bacterium]
MGLLVRPPGNQRSREGSMTIIEHLEDLRRALAISAGAWVLGTLAAWFFSVEILRFIVFRAALPHGLVYLDPTGGFMIRLEIAMAAGTLLASPAIFWQLWWFISPGLHRHERRIVLPLIAATTFFFLLGVALCFYALPLIVGVLSGFAPHDVLQFLPSGDAFLSFLLGLSIAFGLVFQLPVVLWTLGMLGVISSAWLWRNRFYWVSGLGLLANFMTPGGDPLVTPLVVFVPLLTFYLGVTVLLRITGR